MDYEENVGETQCFALEVVINLVVSSRKVVNLQLHVTAVHLCEIFLQCTYS